MRGPTAGAEPWRAGHRCTTTGTCRNLVEELEERAFRMALDTVQTGKISAEIILFHIMKTLAYNVGLSDPFPRFDISTVCSNHGGCNGNGGPCNGGTSWFAFRWSTIPRDTTRQLQCRCSTDETKYRQIDSHVILFVEIMRHSRILNIKHAHAPSELRYRKYIVVSITVMWHSA